MKIMMTMNDPIKDKVDRLGILYVTGSNAGTTKKSILDEREKIFSELLEGCETEEDRDDLKGFLTTLKSMEQEMLKLPVEEEPDEEDSFTPATNLALLDYQVKSWSEMTGKVVTREDVLLYNKWVQSPDWDDHLCVKTVNPNFKDDRLPYDKVKASVESYKKALRAKHKEIDG